MAKKGLSLRQKEMIAGYSFILPWIIGFVLFFGTNFVKAISYSLSYVDTNVEGGGFVLRFIGLDNYINAVAKHATFNRELAESLPAMLIDVPMIIFFSLFIAMLLNRKFKFRGVARVIFFLPVIMATGAITSALNSVLMAMMGGITNVSEQFDQTSGFNVAQLVRTLSEFGLPMIIIDYLVGAVNHVYDIVKSSGVQILIFLAALQAIPTSLYEVAHIEGATKYETLWKVTFPMVSPLILTNVVYTIVDMYSQSDIIQTAYDTAFREQNFGLSSAMSLISATVTCLVLLIVGYGISKKVFYHN